MTELFVTLAYSAFGNTEADFPQNLAWLECCAEHAGKELSRLDGAFTLGSGSNDFRVQSKYRRRPVRPRVGVCQATANCAFVAHLDVPQMCGGFRQQRTGSPQHIRRFDLIMRGRRANADLSAVLANVGKLLDPADVN